MSNRRIWITGASSGLGRAMALEASRRGARLVLSARRADVLARVRDALAHPDAAVVVPVDQADPAGAARAAVDAWAAHDGLGSTSWCSTAA